MKKFKKKIDNAINRKINCNIKKIADLTTHIVHIGIPENEFFSKPVNSTILIVSEGSVEEHLKHVNSTNTILLLEDSR